MDHSGYVIRNAASPLETLQALDLLRSIYVDEGFTDPGVAPRLFSANRLDGQGDLIVAATLDGRVVGAVLFLGQGSTLLQISQPEEAEFRLLGVCPTARGKGCGRLLVEECLRRSRLRGARRIVLSTQPTMLVAHRLYECLGFRRQVERDWHSSSGRAMRVYALELS